MARKEYWILDKKGRPERYPSARYEVISGALDGKPDMYESVTEIQENSGWAAVYRDRKTTATVCMEFDQKDLVRLVLVGESKSLDESLTRFESVVLEIFNFKAQNQLKRVRDQDICPRQNRKL